MCIPWASAYVRRFSITRSICSPEWCFRSTSRTSTVSGASDGRDGPELRPKNKIRITTSAMRAYIGRRREKYARGTDDAARKGEERWFRVGSAKCMLV